MNDNIDLAVGVLSTEQTTLKQQESVRKAYLKDPQPLSWYAEDGDVRLWRFGNAAFIWTQDGTIDFVFPSEANLAEPLLSNADLLKQDPLSEQNSFRAHEYRNPKGLLTHALFISFLQAFTVAKVTPKALSLADFATKIFNLFCKDDNGTRCQEFGDTVQSLLIQSERLQQIRDTLRHFHRAIPRIIRTTCRSTQIYDINVINWLLEAPTDVSLKYRCQALKQQPFFLPVLFQTAIARTPLIICSQLSMMGLLGALF